MNVALPCGSVMKIDADDYARFGRFSWSRRGSEKSGWYVRGKVNGRTESLHRMIMAPASGQVVDHINGDTLDNRRCNLRVCTQADNLKNQRSKRREGCFVVPPSWPLARDHHLERCEARAEEL